jgi:hypothetical protein
MCRCVSDVVKMWTVCTLRAADWCGALMRRIRLAATVTIGVVCALASASCGGLAGEASAGRASAARDGDAPAERTVVLLIPETNAGAVGWCLVNLSQTAAGCSATRSRLPIVAETWRGPGSERSIVGYAVTTSEVAAVIVQGGKPTPTYAEADLPAGLRAAAVELHGEYSSRKDGYPRFMPLDAADRPISQYTAEKTVPPQLSGPLMSEVATRTVVNPARPTSGVCQIKVGTLAGLSVGGGSVITDVRSYRGLIGQGFVTCASTSYTLAGWPLLASVLISASHAGAPPPPLPAMKPLPGHPGVFEAPGPDGSDEEDEMIARRIPGAWLVVSRAKSAQRLTLLERLRVVLSL